ncbi:MAG: hypothetical protein K1X53_10535 [Candidatus Sumerlaeaceae bacterium]|nr:hypothetical protein [Candidatus Sumerlaeaceae bacterium]
MSTNRRTHSATKIPATKIGISDSGTIGHITLGSDFTPPEQRFTVPIATNQKVTMAIMAARFAF